MQHLLLTKLATGIPGDAWLAHRLELFVNYCAPSVTAQTSKNFTWLLAINPETPKWFLDKARVAAPGSAFAHHDGPKIWPNWPRMIKPFVQAGPLITTRFDSDDMLHPEFIEAVQAKAQSSTEDEVIDFPSGFFLRLADFAYYRRDRRDTTPFLSLIEFGDSRKTACHGNHVEFGQQFPVRAAASQPFWIQTCHELNVYNSFDETVPGRISFAARETLSTIFTASDPRP